MFPILFTFGVFQHCFIAINDAHETPFRDTCGGQSAFVEANAGDLIPVTVD